MAFQIEICTPANPGRVMIGPGGKHARPYVYADRQAACSAIADIKAGLRAAGIDVDTDVAYSFIPVAA